MLYAGPLNFKLTMLKSHIHNVLKEQTDWKALDCITNSNATMTETDHSKSVTDHLSEAG